MKKKLPNNAVSSPRSSSKIASTSGCLSSDSEIEEEAIIEQFAKLAACVRKLIGREACMVSFAATFDKLGRRIKCEQHTYDIECVSGRYRGCSGEGDSGHEAIRELIGAMHIRFAHTKIADMQADITRKRDELDRAARLLENERKRLKVNEP